MAWWWEGGMHWALTCSSSAESPALKVGEGRAGHTPPLPVSVGEPCNRGLVTAVLGSGDGGRARLQEGSPEGMELALRGTPGCAWDPRVRVGARVCVARC